MRPPGFMPPGWKLPPEAKAKKEKVRRGQRDNESLVGTEDETPLKFRKHMAKWRSVCVYKKTGKSRQVWREPDGPKGGRFTKKPVRGERAKSLGLKTQDELDALNRKNE